MKHSNQFWKPTLILTACLAVLISFTSQAQETSQRQIKVSGSAAISAVPDQAQIQFTIERQGNKLSAMKTQIDQLTQQFIHKLGQQDVAERQIRSTQFRVYPLYQTDDNGNRQQDGFQVSRTIEVTLHSLAAYDHIIDVALANGVSRVGQIQFTVSNSDELYHQALAKAFEAAKTKAKLLATAAGKELGDAIVIEEYSSPRIMAVPMAEMRTKDSGSPSLPGAQEIEARLGVAFKL